MLWTLDGPYATARYSYRLTSPSLKFDDTGFVDVRAEGSGRLSPWPMRVPLRLTARAITGVGDVAGAILANARLDGILTITPKFVRGEGLQLRSAKLNAKMGLLIDLVTGRFQVVLSGGMTRYFIDGLGIVDVQSELTVVPGPGGKGSRVVGTGKAWVRRLDNSFFAGLTGGLPRIETRLERGPDGIVRFSGMQFYSPKLRLTGEGHRNRDGTFHIVARGRQATYGPLRMVLDGRIERPRVQLFLERPNETLGLRDMTLLLDPNAAGFDYRANGQSPPRAVYEQWPHPAPARRTRGHLDCGAGRQWNAGERRPAGRSWRVHRHARCGRGRPGRDVRLRPDRRRAEDRSAFAGK